MKSRTKIGKKVGKHAAPRGLLVAVLAGVMSLAAVCSGLGRTQRVRAEEVSPDNPRIYEDGTVVWDQVQLGRYVMTPGGNAEPIVWRVLQVDGSDAFLLAEQALDNRPYHDTEASVTWESCSLRGWLNNEFFRTAFDETERAAIPLSYVPNPDNPSSAITGGAATSDYVYLLSIGEACSSAYGFHSAYRSESDTRFATATGAAVANGCEITTSAGYAGNCYWWLRSPGKSSTKAAYVSLHGIGNYNGYDEDYQNVGVRPVLHLNLSVLPLKVTGTVTAKGGSVTANADASSGTAGDDSADGGNAQNAQSDTGSTDASGGGTSASDTAVPDSTAPKKGTTLTDTRNKAKYKVTKAGKSGGTVAYTGTADKKATALSIPATVKLDGISYRVTSVAAGALAKHTKLKSVAIGSNVKTIGAGAFSGCTALKSVTIGKNVTGIGRKAFYGCKSLTSVTIKSTRLKSVGAKAFQGISAKARIKVPAKKLSAYRKLLKGKGQGRLC